MLPPLPHRRRRPSLGAALVVATSLLAAAADEARAQRRVSSSLDLGVSTVRYADTVDASAMSLSPAVRVEGARASSAAQGTFAQTRGGAWVMQGAIDGSVYTGAFRHLVGELAASVGGSAHQDRTRTGETIGTARAHLIGASRGAWIGGGGGQAWDGAAWHAVALGEVGAWWSHDGGAAIVASATPTMVDVGGATARYTDASLGARWAGARAELSGSFGGRVGHDSVARLGGATTWGSLAGAYWIAGPLALAVSGGSYPVDYTQGYPGGRYLAVSLRVGTRPSVRDSVVPAATLALPGGGGAQASASPPPALAAPTLEIVSTADADAAAAVDRRTVLVTAPRTAVSVEIAGDFTNWDAVALGRRSDGRWGVVLPLAAGVHQAVVRVNGGAWLVPAGLPPIDDEFGGAAGLLVVAASAGGR